VKFIAQQNAMFVDKPLYVIVAGVR